jgi:hypothetical protein
MLADREHVEPKLVSQFGLLQEVAHALRGRQLSRVGEGC